VCFEIGIREFILPYFAQQICLNTSYCIVTFVRGECNIDLNAMNLTGVFLLYNNTFYTSLNIS